MIYLYRAVAFDFNDDTRPCYEIRVVVLPVAYKLDIWIVINNTVSSLDA